ncbi:hypothetical protein BC938DRAFT_473174 [Jimgerdemannia flammicorona]|uniref:Tetratricopeptide repeat-domain-containing protein n=1 Tax=Jimgerdemannia flammicorona TaxID=994334 RepID=A0A433Q4I0_9FUNG|nr:hypothetical protein BC938DRAFT_473174 [Jimgerdemannia flammicorona]
MLFLDAQIQIPSYGLPEPVREGEWDRAPANSKNSGQSGRNLQKPGKYDKAKALSQRALAIIEKVFGPEHPETSLPQHNLARIYVSHGKYDEVELLYHDFHNLLVQHLRLVVFTLDIVEHNQIV